MAAALKAAIKKAQTGAYGLPQTGGNQEVTPTDYVGAAQPETSPFVVSSPGDDPAVLRERIMKDGYLFLPALLPREEVLAVRAKFVEILRKNGWIDEQQEDMLLGTRSAPELFNMDRVEGFPGYGSVFHAFQSLESFHALSQHPALLSVLEEGVFGERPFPHPRNIGRVSFPRPGLKTQPHQDWFYIQGAPSTTTAWVPLGDVPQTHGALMVLSGSCQHGFRLHESAKDLGLEFTAGGFGTRVKDLEEEKGCKWVCSNFRAGDVLLFNSLTVHGALPNESQEIRLSADFRYSGISQPVVVAAVSPHMSAIYGGTWEEWYSGNGRPWKDKADGGVKYYWKDDLPRLNIVEQEPFDHLLSQTELPQIPNPEDPGPNQPMALSAIQEEIAAAEETALKRREKLRQREKSKSKL